MPTKRAWSFLILALVLYLLANQTQVGWVYLISDSLVGLVVAGFLFSRGVLKSVQVKRSIASPAGQPHRQPPGVETGDPDLVLPTFFEDDPLEVTLQFSQAGLRPALLVGGNEVAPFAPPAEQVQPWFVPSLFRGQPVLLNYRVSCDRRGLYSLPGLALHSAGPFGLFKARRTVPAPGEVLIYPYYHPLKRLRALERKEFAEQQARRAGTGSQVIGTREYRSGDSLRQIHWRSTAHAGKLVVKEFTEDEQISLTIVLDLSGTASVGEGKYSTFETAIRLAASLAYYADQKKIPFHLVGAGQRPSPAGRLSWWASLNYLARVGNDGDRSLTDVLAHLNSPSFVVVLVSNPDPASATGVMALAHRGTPALAICITPDGAALPTWPNLKVAGLDIRWVSPYNWPERLGE